MMESKSKSLGFFYLVATIIVSMTVFATIKYLSDQELAIKAMALGYEQQTDKKTGKILWKKVIQKKDKL